MVSHAPFWMLPEFTGNLNGTRGKREGELKLTLFITLHTTHDELTPDE
jgi:hypothetical protein